MSRLAFLLLFTAGAVAQEARHPLEIQALVDRARALPRGRSLPAGVKLVDLLLEILHGARAPHLHGGGQLALLDGKIARQDAVFADLLEGRELFVHARHSLVDLGQPWSAGRYDSV